jgi:hypothetical protein
MDKKVIQAYREIAKLTGDKCATCRIACVAKNRCCSPEYCQIALDLMKERGVIPPIKTEHPTLMFMSDTGCLVPPEHRPLCSLHHCDINGVGAFRNDPKSTERYYKLREIIELNSL